MTLETFGVRDRVVRIAHSGPRSRTFCLYSGGSRPALLFEGVVGATTPTSWEEGNVLPTWRLTLEGETAERRYDDFVSVPLPTT